MAVDVIDDLPRKGGSKKSTKTSESDGEMSVDEQEEEDMMDEKPKKHHKKEKKHKAH